MFYLTTSTGLVYGKKTQFEMQSIKSPELKASGSG